MTVGPAALFAASSRRGERRAIDYVHLTGPQDEWTRIGDPEAYWVDGNALGKSFAAAWEIIQFLRRKHPHKRKRGGGPVVGLVLGYSYEQMLPLMEKLWFLVPKEELDPTVGFTEGRGFTGKPPRLRLRSGDRVVFATYKSGSRRIAGGQYDFVVCDEPPESRVIGEVRPRLLRRRGWLRILMTPTPDMPDITDLRERIASGRVPCQTVTLTEASCWPKGYPSPWHWQDEIDAYAATLLPNERGMRIRGDLRPVVTGRWIHGFDEGRHVRPISVRELVGWRLTLGVDHGTTGRKQAAVLVATRVRYDEAGQRRPQARWLAESVSDGFTTTEQDARAIRRMLERRGIPIDALDDIVGDVPVYSQREDVRKTNAELRRALAAEYQRPVSTVRPIGVPNKSHGSLVDTSRGINTLFVRDDALVDPSCPASISALLTFDGDREHPEKDVYDAGRYAATKGTGPIDRALVAHY